METVEEIQQALERLTVGDRLAIGRWLQELDRAGAKGYGVAEPIAKYAVPDPLFMTLEEFFKFEEHSKIRHEYVHGAVFAMSGASVAHERIRHRLVMAFGNHLISGPCQVFSSGMQLVIRREASEICYYPDVMVDCRRDAWGSHFVRGPTLVLEILSQSAELSADRFSGGICARRTGRAQGDDLSSGRRVATAGLRGCGGSSRIPLHRSGAAVERDL
jgi:hypothetical protein